MYRISMYRVVDELATDVIVEKSLTDNASSGMELVSRFRVFITESGKRSEPIAPDRSFKTLPAEIENNVDAVVSAYLYGLKSSDTVFQWID